MLIDETALDGIWVGENVDPGHAQDDVFDWRMFIDTVHVRIKACDDTGNCLRCYEGLLSTDGVPFSFGRVLEGIRVTRLDAQHVLVDWSEHEQVVFSRPGLPELTVEPALAQLRGFHAPMRVYHIIRWATT